MKDIGRLYTVKEVVLPTGSLFYPLYKDTINFSYGGKSVGTSYFNFTTAIVNNDNSITVKVDYYFTLDEANARINQDITDINNSGTVIYHDYVVSL
jgi:hypothetical protein